MRYVIRRPGCTSWAESDDLNEAVRLLVEAKERHSGQRVLLIDTETDCEVSQDEIIAAMDHGGDIDG